MYLMKQPKVVHAGPYLLGVSGSARVANLVQHCLDVPAPTGNIHGYMVTTFIDALRNVLKDGGVATKTSEQEWMCGSWMLVGIHGHLFEIASDYQVHEPLDPYAAIGSGYDPCLGVLYATPKAPPSRRLRLAMEAAERYNAGVRAPFTYISERTTTTTKKD